MGPAAGPEPLALLGRHGSLNPMNIAYRTPLTVPEYLAWADAQSERPRTELIDGQIIRMAPELIEHVELKLEIAIALRQAIEKAAMDFWVLTEGAAVAVSDGSAFQPDALVYAGPRLPRGTRVIPAPLLVVEILSPTTAHIDRGVKLAGYFTLPSLQHYLIIDPETMSVTHHQRRAAGSIASDTLTGGTLTLDPPGLALDLDRILTR